MKKLKWLKKIIDDMRNYLFLILFSISSVLISQTVETKWFEPIAYSISSKAEIVKVSKDCIYYFVNNRSSATFYKSDFDGNEKFSKTFSFPNINSHAIFIDDIVEFNEEFLLIVRVSTDDRISLMAQKINTSGELKSDFLMLSTVKSSEKSEIELDFAISPDKRNIASVTTNSLSNGEKEKISIAIFDSDLTEIWKNSIVQTKGERIGTSSEVILNDYREVYILQKSFYNGYYKYSVLSLSSNMSGYKETSLHIDGISPTSLKAKLNNDQNLVVAGYYTESQLVEKIVTHGCFYVRFNGIEGLSKAYSKFSESQFDIGKPTNMKLLDISFDSYGVIILTGKCDVKSFSEVAGSMGSVEIPPYNKGLSINSFLENGNPGYAACYGYFAPDEEDKLEIFSTASTLNDNKPFVFHNELGPTQYELSCKLVSFDKFKNTFKANYVDVQPPFVFYPSIIKKVKEDFYVVTAITPNQLRFGVLRVK